VFHGGKLVRPARSGHDLDAMARAITAATRASCHPNPKITGYVGATPG
jgi:hypothetical protein